MLSCPTRSARGSKWRSGCASRPRRQYSRSASLPRTVPSDSGTSRAASGLVKTASAAQWESTRSRSRAFHAAYHSSAKRSAASRVSTCRSYGAAEMALQRGEPIVPLGADLLHPADRLRERRRRQRVARLAAGAGHLDEPGVLQRGEVLRDRLPRDRELARELGRRRTSVSAREQLDERP